MVLRQATITKGSKSGVEQGNRSCKSGERKAKLCRCHSMPASSPHDRAVGVLLCSLLDVEWYAFPAAYEVVETLSVWLSGAQITPETPQDLRVSGRPP